ncbi:MAG: BrnT family toxin [Chloroflexota bacterium]|nr:BrnT family toxin [Chloroflexota bacterium]
MRWTWDENKNTANRIKQGIGFETAQLVFEDSFSSTEYDRYEDEDRFHTIGMVEGRLILVVHTLTQEEYDGPEGGRIIGARKPTPHEKRAYEEATG